MRFAARRLLHVIGLAVAVMLTSPAGAFAQATGTINGRVLDQAEAVLPGVTITVTNVNTGVARLTATNAEGVYNAPGLEPGLYTITAELLGFATTTREGVSLAITATITIDLTMGVAALTETVTVAGASPLIEVTQSKVSATIRTQEVENLPLLTRRFSQLMALLPGAKAVAPLHPLKRQSGSVSIGGSAGRNVVPVVDGGDNRDTIVGGAMMSFTVEGIEEFRVQTHQFSAADGRTSGAAVNILTKSGTNQPHGSAFFYGRDRALAARDYFAVRDNLREEPFRRTQFGGSFGGPIVRNRAFYFGAVERIAEDKSLTVSDSLYKELQLLVPFGALPSRSIAQPYRDTLYTIKSNVQLSSNHSLVGRFAGQKNDATNGGKTQRNDLTATQIEPNRYWDAIVQHSWVVGSRTLNQVAIHASHASSFSDYYGLSGGPYLKNYPNVVALPITNNLFFPSVTIGSEGRSYSAAQDMWQLRNDLTLQVGSHSLKMGGDYSWFPTLGGECCLRWGTLRFFDDPSVILSNSNGKYPQGFQTPGIVQRWEQGADIRTNTYALPDTAQVKGYVQDDWRVGRRLTLNLGVRYDVDINFFNQTRYENNLGYQVLRAIGDPYGQLPRTPTKDISPRVGFAYDIGGDGRRVLRGGYGVYFEGNFIQNQYAGFVQASRPISFEATRINTGIGVGQLGTLRLGIDPLPERPTITDRLPPGASSKTFWLDPNITDARNHQSHLGYTQELGPNTVLSADFTHIEGRNDYIRLEINPILNGVRRLAPALAEVYGDPNLIGSFQIDASISRSRYDELAILFERRMPRMTFRATYVLSSGYAYNRGQIGGTSAPDPEPQQWDQPFAEGEWGPTLADERHRVVLWGVLELPYGFQLSPIFQAATPRPYNLTAGLDLNKDGLTNDHYVDPATGRQVSVNSARGDSTVLLDMRATRFFTLGGRRLGVFAEIFNLFNKANFGEAYQGNGRSSVFKQPIGFLAGGQGTYPFTLQLGARFEF